MDKIIIHISGATGSGKTTLGNKLKEKYKVCDSFLLTKPV